MLSGQEDQTSVTLAAWSQKRQQMEEIAQGNKDNNDNDLVNELS